MSERIENEELLERFWQGYLDTLGDAGDSVDGVPRSAERPEAWYFCDNEPCANELAALVLAGTKTATCGSVAGYEYDGEPIPQVGDLSIVTDWGGVPLCVIETTEVTIRAYRDVDAQFAYDEGEGDRSLGYWREAHRRFFTRECAEIGGEFDENMPLACERFRLVYVPADM